MTGILSFGRWVSLRRKSLEFTQDALAAQVAISVHTLRKIETDERRPSRQVAELLADALQISPDEREMFIRAARQEASSARLATPFAPGEARQPPSLPALTTPVVGRERELNELQLMLLSPECRLVTLSGPGGIGKTLLALAAAHVLVNEPESGLNRVGAFVPLAGVSSGKFASQAVARALDLNFGGAAPPLAQLRNYLRDQALLLVLDNAEHLLGDVEGSGDDFIQLITTLLRDAPKVKLLATSREPLNVQGEWAYEVKGLALPPGEASDDFESAGAAALFLGHARRVRYDFALTPEDRAAVLRICGAVAGAPLGIELAASWLRLLSPREIAAEVERNLDFLQSSRRDIEPRHRSLRAVFDHSWRLLTDDERRALGQLSVFRGGFTAEAALEVAGASLSILASLISKSLVRRGPGGRYDLHELIRQFAAGHLDADEAASNDAHGRHAAYYFSLLSQRQKQLTGSGQIEAVEAFKPDMDNLNAAYERAIACGLFSLIERTVTPAYILYQTLGLFRAREVVFARAAQAARQAIARDGPTPERLAALGTFETWRAGYLFRLGSYGEARELAEHGLKLVEAHGDSLAMFYALAFAGTLANVTGDYALAAARAEQQPQLAAQLADDHLMAVAALHSVRELPPQGRMAEAYERLHRALALLAQHGEMSVRAGALMWLSQVCIALGKQEEAEAHALESVRLNAQLGDRFFLGLAHDQVGRVRLARGDAAGALEHARLARKLLEQMEARRDTGVAIGLEGYALGKLNQFDEGVRILKESVLVALQADALPNALDNLCYLAETLLAAQPDDVEQPLAWLAFAQTHPASPMLTRQRAERLLAEASANISPEQIEAARAAAATVSMDDVVRALEVSSPRPLP
jgi:predicted ATPase/transcriptional regulator with XRE-family HTH domain